MIRGSQFSSCTSLLRSGLIHTLERRCLCKISHSAPIRSPTLMSGVGSLTTSLTSRSGSQRRRTLISSSMKTVLRRSIFSLQSRRCHLSTRPFQPSIATDYALPSSTLKVRSRARFPSILRSISSQHSLFRTQRPTWTRLSSIKSTTVR